MVLQVLLIWNTGRITGYLPPGGPFLRMDSHIYTDYVVPPSYDSLLGKVSFLRTQTKHMLLFKLSFFEIGDTLPCAADRLGPN